MAAVYAFVVAVFVYRDLKFKDVPGVLLESSKLTIMIMFIVANALLFAHVLTTERIPQIIASQIISWDMAAWQFLIVVNILLLIAGTYTPFALLALGGALGWALFAAIWALALIGTVLEFMEFRGRHGVSIALYLVMGWLGIASLGPLSAALGPGGTTLMLAGGLAYTLGVPFYLWRGLAFHFVLWHAFVLAGSILHFFAVLLYVVN